MIGCRGGCPCEHYACHDNTPPDLIDTHLLLINPKIKSGSSPSHEQIKWNLVKKKTGFGSQSGYAKSKFVSSYQPVVLKYPPTFEGQRSQGFIYHQILATFGISILDKSHVLLHKPWSHVSCRWNRRQ